MFDIVTKLIVTIMLLGGSSGLGEEADPVKVTVYYESLCPDSIRFFKNQLEPTYGELSSIMVVETFAYGKASDKPIPGGNGYVFKCQHGQGECYGNKVLACGQKWIADHDTFLNFNFCVMDSDYPPSSGNECSNEEGIVYAPIEHCANTTEGENLLHNVGIQQSELNPTLTYVPWIIINDVYSDDNLDAAQKDLKGLVCSTYQGTPPAQCILPKKH